MTNHYSKTACYCCYENEEFEYDELYEEEEYEDYDGADADPYANIGAAWEQRVMEERLWAAREQQRIDAAENERWALLDEAWTEIQRQDHEAAEAFHAECQEAQRAQWEADQLILQQQDEEVLAELEG